MSDLTKKISMFFESECKSFSELDVLLTESALQKEWLDAVALYRKGMIALQKNDLSGMESMAAANEALKKVISAGKKEKTDASIKAFSESIEKMNKDKLTESIVNIKLAFTTFYNTMKSAGYTELINENNFYEDGTNLLKEEEEDLAIDPMLEPDTDGQIATEEPAINVKNSFTALEAAVACVKANIDAKQGYEQGLFDLDAEWGWSVEDVQEKIGRAKEIVKSGKMEEEICEKPEMSPTANKQSIASEPIKEPVSQGTEQTSTQIKEEKRSAYQDGFEAGRKSWSKDAKNHKEQLQTTITQGLSESPYSYVTRFSEGFAAGFEHERLVQEDMCPEMFKTIEEPTETTK